MDFPLEGFISKAGRRGQIPSYFGLQIFPPQKQNEKDKAQVSKQLCFPGTRETEQKEYQTFLSLATWQLSGRGHPSPRHTENLE